MQSLEKYTTFKKWLKEHGANFDNIEYPVAFHIGGFLSGVAAVKDL
jgi:hypothetical protein